MDQFKKTWFHCLEDAGRPIINDANSIFYRMLYIEGLKQQIREAEDEIKDLESALFAQVAEHWTIDDINAAKNRFAALS